MHRLVTVIVIILATITSSACLMSKQNRGYNPEYVDFTKVRVGQSKMDILKALGSPSSTSTSEDRWYYISSKTRDIAFTKDRISDMQVVEIVFNSNNNVKAINKDHSKNAADINFSSNKTDVENEGKGLGGLKSILGNFGRTLSKTE